MRTGRRETILIRCSPEVRKAFIRFMLDNDLKTYEEALKELLKRVRAYGEPNIF